jgi:RNA polymerase sigma factor (sigma-70 family)
MAGCAEAMSDDDTETEPLTPRVIDRLVENHREFLAFLERRLGDRALAEDILQEAFVRGLHKAATVEQEESSVAWFYRVLRNAVVDHARRRAAYSRRLDALAVELESHIPDEELTREVCQCVGRLAGTLKPEYADAMRRIDVDGMSMKEFAEHAGITSNNAAVRVFRAREALRKQLARSCGSCATHGCLDCTCQPPSA